MLTEIAEKNDKIDYLSNELDTLTKSRDKQLKLYESETSQAIN